MFEMNSIGGFDFIKAKMKKIFMSLAIIFTACLMIGPEARPLEDSANPIIRVLVLDNADSVSLAIKGSYRVYSVSSNKLLTGGYILHTKVTASDDGINFGARNLKFSKIRISVPKNSLIYLDGRSFRGTIDIVRNDKMRLMVINNIPLEEYLYGVLHNEVSHRWPIEAIKAQAVAARTFALYQIRQNKLQDYDLTSDIYSQVYSGAAAERWSTTRAVRLTAAQVLTYNGDIFPTYYHATCGGHTEDASNLWNIDIPPLKGVECTFCKQSPHFKWNKKISLTELNDKLRQKGYSMGKIASLTVLSRNNSGRVDKLEIKDEAAVSCILTAKDFRQMMGPNEIRSTNFEASINNDKLVLNGIGWGHGAGMCQWGANGMAERNKKYDEILKYYYPGTEITRIKKIKI